MVERVSAVTPDALSATEATPGLEREVAFQSERALQVRVRAAANTTSGWHHHGTREVFGYVVKGEATFEFGPGGRDRTDVEEGGFFHVPVGLVHRDVNPHDSLQELVIAFVGDGPLVVNLDGPEPG